MFVALLLSISAVQADINVETMAQQLNPKLYMSMDNVPETEKLAQLTNYELQLKNAQAANPNNPQLWWLAGLHAWSVLYAWDDSVSLDKNRAQKEIGFSAFRKALELDKTHEPHLTLDMLYSLKTFGSSDVHIEAARRILAANPALDKYEELEIRGGMAVHYTELGRYEEALKVFDEFEEKYPEEYTTELQFKRNYHNNKINKAKQAKLDQTNTPTPATNETAHSATEQPSQTVTETPVPPPDNAEVTDLSKQNILYAILLLGLIIAAGLFIYRRKK